MNALELFLVSTGISFAGSLQLGPVNSQVLRESFRKNTSGALKTALGGSLPEILYAGLAAFLIGQVGRYENLEIYFRLLFVLIIGGIGIYYLLSKKQKSDALKPVKNKKTPFLTGFLLALFNPQLIFFWSGILVVLGISMPNTAQIIGFTLGAFTGALLLLLTFTFLGIKLSDHHFFSKSYLIDRILGIILLSLSLFEAVRLLLD